MKSKYFLVGIIVAFLVVLSLAIGLFTPLGFLESFRVVFGSIYVLFLPGFLITWIIFPKNKANGIDWLERIALSFALSIAIVPLVVFYLNLIGLKISALMSFLTVTLINLIACAVIYWRITKDVRKSNRLLQ